MAEFARRPVPTVLGAIMWGFLYTPGFSPVTDTLHLNVLGPRAILWGIANVVTWTWTGYNALIIYSSLQTIDPGLYEAARVDGARGWQIALRIKLPLVLPALAMTALFSIVGTVQLFTEPMVLQPVSSAITSTYTPNPCPAGPRAPPGSTDSPWAVTGRAVPSAPCTSLPRSCAQAPTRSSSSSCTPSRAR
jgi:multiple sugar transport system permease protein